VSVKWVTTKGKIWPKVHWEGLRNCKKHL